jgi:hypothetical protein
MPAAFLQDNRASGGYNESPIQTVASGGALVVYAQPFTVLRVKQGAGATATVTEVDAGDATAHGATDVTTDAVGDTGVVVRWPFYRITSAGGSCTVAGI